MTASGGSNRLARPARRGRRAPRARVAAAAWLVAVLVGLAGCERAEVPVVEQSVRPAKLVRVTSDPMTVVHEFVGRVDAAQTIDVSFEVDGTLAQLPVREAQAVARGALVAALDPVEFDLAVREADVQLRLAAQDLARKEALLREGVVSVALVDDARAQRDLGQVRLAQARERLARSRITAPFDAFVARRYVDNHTNVRAGEPIVRLSDLDEMKVVVSLPENLVATVTPAHVVAVSAAFDFQPDVRFPLTYRESTGEANAVAQTYEVTFTMARPDGANVLPGMTANVRVELNADAADTGITIPASALLSEPDGRFFVWVFDPADGRVSRRAVTVTGPGPRGIGVAGGLRDGERIVAAGASQLQAGMQVRPLDDPSSDPSSDPPGDPVGDPLDAR